MTTEPRMTPRPPARAAGSSAMAAASGDGPAPRIVASWRRCRERGLLEDRLEVPWTSDVDLDAPLVRVADPVLQALEASLAGEPVSVMISGGDGVVVSRFCSDRRILAALDEVSLAPGSTYSEAAVGTNGFGLALVDDRASLVRGAEHYAQALSSFTCAGTPVHDPASGRVVAALSLTTWSARRPDLLMALAAQTAMNIETRLATHAGAASVEQLDGFLRGIADRRSGAGAGAARGPRLTRLEQLERRAMVEALERAGGRVADAGAELGLSRATMYRRIRHYRIELRAG